MPDTTVKLQDITPVKSTFDNDDQLLLINPTGEARISKEDFLDAMPDDAITLIGDITTTGIEGDTVAKQLGALKNSKAPAITDTATGVIANFPDGAEDIPVTSLMADIEPKQSGSGDPSPSNIRPISGWTGVNVTRTGKNLFDSSIFPASASQNIIYVHYEVPNGTYTMSTPDFPLVGGLTNVFFLAGSVSSGAASGSSGVFQSTPRTITVTDGNYTVAYRSSNDTNTNNPKDFKWQIELGSTATDYEAYQSTALSVNWQTEAGTVYVGTIDVATGLLTVTDANIASYAGETLPSTWISDRDVYAQGTTPTTGAQVVYKLATPQTYQLTPQQLMTLLGTNNVWADTGNVSVTYPADTKMFIEKLTMPTEDDLVANQAITSGKYFMIGNSLYLALANIASGAQITIGTNAQRVSLADALNTINS